MRGLGGVQKLAYNLVAMAVLVLPSLPRLAVLPASAASLAAARPPAATVTYERPWLPDAAAARLPAAPAEQAAPAPSTSATPMAYVVQRYDCLWDIAEEYLGDAFRWPEIEALTAGLIQPDGRQLEDPNLIYPGWTVLLPPDAVGLPPAPAATYPSTAPASDLPTPAPAAPQAGAPDVEAAGGAIGSVTTGAASRAQPGAGAVGRVVGAAPPTSTPTGMATAPTASRATSGASGVGGRPAPQGVGSGGLKIITTSAVAAAGVSSLLAGIFVWRMWREGSSAHRRRRSGRTLAQPDPTTEAVERRVRAIAAVDTVHWVDATLRYASAVLAEAGGGGVEGIVCVRPGRLGMELVVDPAAAPVGRFESVDGGRTWTLDPDMELAELQDLAWGQVLVPALCSVGNSADGPVLVDLEHAGVLSVEGDPGRVAAFLAGASLELATAPWTNDTALCLLGGDDRLAMRELVEAVEDDVAFVAGVDQLSSLVGDEDLDGARSTLAARVAPGNAEGWFPTVVVAHPGTDTGVLAQLAERARPRCSGLALVAPGPFRGATWRLLLAADGRAVLEPLGLELDAQVDAEVVAALVGRLSTRAEHADIAPVVELVAELPAVANADVLDGEIDDEPIEGEVRILGPVEVTWAGGQPPERVGVLAAVVAYLGAHDDHPVPGERLQEAVWPLRYDEGRSDVRAGAVKDDTLRATLSRARKALGKDSLGRHHLLYARGGAYELGSRFKCDWSRFRGLVQAARTASTEESIELYRQALSLVRGRPFQDAPAGPFAWADDSPLVSDIEVEIVRAAEELGQRALEANDPELAAWAARQGLLVVPVREHLSRVRMQAAFDAGDADGVDQAYTDAARAVRQFIDPSEQVQDGTERLYQRLKRASRSRGHAERQDSEAEGA